MGAVNECIPLYEEGEAITATAVGAVTGKTVVDIAANMEGPAGAGLVPDGTQAGSNIKAGTCAAGARGIGVASYDAADTRKFYVVGEPGQVVPITAGAAITHGQEVEVGAAGKVIPHAAGVAIGKAIADAANAADALVRLY